MRVIVCTRATLSKRFRKSNIMYSAVLKDYNKVVEKLGVLDDGDDIKLIYVPANNETQSNYIERIGIDESELPQEEI